MVIYPSSLLRRTGRYRRLLAHQPLTGVEELFAGVFVKSLQPTRLLGHLAILPACFPSFFPPVADSTPQARVTFSSSGTLVLGHNR
jgi:hypothetical protein